MTSRKASGLAAKLAPWAAGCAALALVLCGGCSGGCSKAEDGDGEKPVGVAERLAKDPEYEGKLRTLENEQGAIMQRGADVKRLLAAAKEAGDEAEQARLQAQLEEIAKEMQASQQKAAGIVRERIRQAQAEQKIYEQKHAQQQKGK